MPRGMTAKYYNPEGPNTVTFLGVEAKKRGVHIHDGIRIIQLLQNDSRITGAIGITDKREFIVFRAKAVVLASGGANFIFPNPAPDTNHPQFHTTGDSYYLAFNVGAPLIDLEFTQFRDSPPGAAKYGGKYLNALGERFMEKYDPQRLEKAPRAKVVESIYREMMAGRGPIKWEVGGIREAEAANITTAGKYATQKEIPIGIDFQRVLGGAQINEKAETSIPGLFAAGEASGGVQGGGRMQGAAFLETQVFGTNAGKNAAALALSSRLKEISQAQLKDNENKIKNIKGSVDPAEFIRNIQKVMWEQVGVVRSADGLNNAIDKFSELKSKLPQLAGESIFSALDATNLLFTAEIIARSALAREETRGAQVRSDYPQANDEKWLKHVSILNQGGEISVSTLPVIQR